MDRDIWAIDLTSDFQIPCFVGLSKKKTSSNPQLLFGFGCHFDAKIALQRAISEMAQMTNVAGMCKQEESTELDIEDKDSLHWLNNATTENQPYLLPSEKLPKTTLHTHRSQSTGDLAKDIALCCKLVEDKKMELLVLNQTKNEVGVPTVKVIVPGLRHFWARFAPGRLFDVPVELGWREAPLKEEELNPINMFL